MLLPFILSNREKKLKDTLSTVMTVVRDMPSSKVLVDELECSPPFKRAPKPPCTPLVKQADEKAVVSYEQWLENEEDYLLNIYESIQEMNSLSGRRAFDRNTCDFPSFCRIAYRNSFKYKKQDKHIYEGEGNDLAYENADTYVFE